MKKIFILILLAFSLNCYSQNKDTTKAISDSTELVSLKDFDVVLSDLQDKATKRQWEDAKYFYQLAVNQAIARRNKKKKP